MQIKNILLLSYAWCAFAVFSSRAVVIDTRFESATADQDKAIIYSMPRVINDGDEFYGSVEFSNGIVFNTPLATPDVILGVTPPIAGSLRFPPAVSDVELKVAHDLTLSVSLLENVNPSVIFLGISPNPSQVFLTRDLVLTNSMSLFILSDSGGIFNGTGHSIIATQTIQSIVVSSQDPDGITLKNISIAGVGGDSFGFGGSILAPMIFENVSILTPKDRVSVFFPANFTYKGLGNIIGNGGNVVFVGGGLVNVDTNTRIHVTPTTIFELGQFMITFFDKTSELFLDNCTLQLGQGPTLPPAPVVQTFKKGTMFINGVVNLTARTVGASLQLGDGIDSANNFDIVILPGSKLIVNDGVTLINKNV